MTSSKEQNRGVRFPLVADLAIIALASIIAAAVIWGVPHEEEDLTARAEAVLEGTDLGVEFEGRYAILSGNALSQPDLDEAADAIRGLRGVHSVNTGDVGVLTEIPGSSDWLGLTQVRAGISAGAITLSGTVPDQASVDAIVAAAVKRFGADAVINEFVVDAGLSAPEWLAIVPDVLAVSDDLDEGGITFSGTQVVIAGIVDSALERANLVDAVTAVVGDTATVEQELQVVTVDAPTLGAVFDAGTITLRGLLPDESTAAGIVDAAETSFGADNVDDRFTVSGSVGSPDYLEAIPGIFDSLTQLDTWTITLQDDVITIWGQGSAEAVSDTDNALADLVDEDLEVVVDLQDNDSAVATQLTDLLTGTATFETGSAVLSSAAKALLDEAIGVLLNNPDVVLIVEGYTDDVGDAEVNLTLSEARAQAVVDYLVAGGVPADRLSAVGYGEEDPIATNSTEEGRALNRRIEFVIREGDG